MFSRRRIEIAAALALLLTLLISAAYMRGATKQQQDMAQKMVRLHVLANSDSEEDQRRKLLVKDAVFARTEELLRTSGGQKEAVRSLQASLTELEQLAEQALRADGQAENVTVTLTKSRFLTRYYDGFALPAGEYPSLRVSIGAGMGQNWWCVVFPPLCSAGQESFETAAKKAGLTEDEVDLIRSGEQQYLLRFRTLELLERLCRFFSDGQP